MYEITISVPHETRHLLNYVKEQTEQAIAEMDGIATDVEDKRRCYFSVACSDTFRFQLKRLVLESVSEAVALGYKNIFVRNCLKIKQGNFFQNVLINTMCVFDKAYDSQIISKILDVDKPMFIDGYCNFKMEMLKKKWSEIAKLVSQNNYILHDNRLIMEFLQYLLDSLNSGISKLSVSFENDTFCMYDSDSKVLPVVTSLSINPNAEEEAALNVLLLKPQKVTVYYNEKPSEDFVNLMSLFDCKYIQAN